MIKALAVEQNPSNGPMFFTPEKLGKNDLHRLQESYVYISESIELMQKAQATLLLDDMAIDLQMLRVAAMSLNAYKCMLGEVMFFNESVRSRQPSALERLGRA